MNQNENRAVKAVAFITAVCLLGDSMLYVVLPIHWQEAGLASLSEVLILLSINPFIRFPLNPFVTWVYGRLRLQSGVLIAVVIAAVTTASYGLVKEFWLWLIMRSLWGVAWTFFRQGAYFTIIDLSNERRVITWACTTACTGSAASPACWPAACSPICTGWTPLHSFLP